MRNTINLSNIQLNTIVDFVKGFIPQNHKLTILAHKRKNYLSNLCKPQNILPIHLAWQFPLIKNCNNTKLNIQQW